MSLTAEMIIMGYKQNYYIEDATDNAATNLKFTSTTAQEYTVPTGKRWILIGGQVTRDASGTIAVDIYDSSDKKIMKLNYQSAAVNTVPLIGTGSSTHVSGMAGPIVLDAGEYVKLAFGAAQGAGASAACIVIEVSV